MISIRNSIDEQEMIFRAVQELGYKALEPVSDALKSNETFMLKIVSCDGRALLFAATHLKSNKELALTAVTSHPDAFKYVAPTLQFDRDIVFQALKYEKNEVLQYLLGTGTISAAWKKLMADREIMLINISRDGWWLKFASHDLQSDPVCIAAMIRSVIINPDKFENQGKKPADFARDFFLEKSIEKSVEALNHDPSCAIASHHRSRLIRLFREIFIHDSAYRQSIKELNKGFLSHVNYSSVMDIKFFYDHPRDYGEGSQRFENL